MMRKIILLLVVLGLTIFAAPRSYSLESFKFMVERSTLWCPGGVVALDEPENVVVDKCGAPVEIIQKENLGPVWVYTFRSDRFMYYLVMLDEKIQRIASTPCNQHRYDCFDLR